MHETYKCHGITLSTATGGLSPLSLFVVTAAYNWQKYPAAPQLRWVGATTQAAHAN